MTRADTPSLFYLAGHFVCTEKQIEEEADMRLSRLANPLRI
jgi:hypothetical protein